MISEFDLNVARRIRQEVGPMRDESGRINASAMAQELTLRDRHGLPGWIAELDAPRNGQDQMKDQNMPEDQTRDPGDTMPAQGWMSLPDAFKPAREFGRPVVITITDAGRFPAPREDNTMDRDTIPTAEMREDFDHASKRASTIAQFATMHPEQRLEELEARPIRELRELHHQAAGTERWHQQGVQDARDLSRTIGQVLRAAGDEIDPQAKVASGEARR